MSYINEYLLLLGYNIAHALFSSTASIIQTSLVLQQYPWKSKIVNDDASKTIKLNIFEDPKIHPAYYLIFISIVSFCALVLAERMAKRKRSNRFNRSEKTQFVSVVSIEDAVLIETVSVMHE